MVGLEHEYRVVGSGGQADFCALIHRLGLGRRELDPGDLNAYRQASGSVVTADEREAEIALAPTPVAAGFTLQVAREARHAQRDLEGLLPDGLRLDGYSTHLSVSIPSPRASTLRSCLRPRSLRH